MNHPEIIRSLEDRLKQFCDEVETETEYVLESGQCGEYDILARRKKDYFAIEVKRTDNSTNRHKAMKQLDRDFKYIKENYSPEKIILLYAYSSRNGYNIEMIRK